MAGKTACGTTMLQWHNLLERGNKRSEVEGGVFHEQQPGQSVVEDCAIAGVVLEESEMVTGVVLQHEVDSLQFLQKLAAHVAGGQVLRDAPPLSCPETCKC